MLEMDNPNRFDFSLLSDENFVRKYKDYFLRNPNAMNDQNDAYAFSLTAELIRRPNISLQDIDTVSSNTDSILDHLPKTNFGGSMDKNAIM